MVPVLEYGVKHPSCLEIVPPSPGCSSDDVSRQDAIRHAHQVFQSGLPVVPGPAVPTVPPASPSPASEPPVAPSGTVSYPSNEMSRSSDVDGEVGSHASVLYPADNPAPGSVAGGHDPFESFLELGDVEFDEAALNWFRLSSAPTEFKLVRGRNGREFLFCMPDPAGVDVEQVEGVGHRTVGLQTRRCCPHPLDPKPPVAPASVHASCPSLEHSEVEAGNGGDGDDSSSSDSESPTTLSSTAVEQQMEEFRASLELTK